MLLFKSRVSFSEEVKTRRCLLYTGNPETKSTNLEISSELSLSAIVMRHFKDFITGANISFPPIWSRCSTSVNARVLLPTSKREHRFYQFTEMSLVAHDLHLPGKNDVGFARMESHSIVGKYFSASLMMSIFFLTSVAITWLPRVANQHIFSVVRWFIFTCGVARRRSMNWKLLLLSLVCMPFCS